MIVCHVFLYIWLLLMIFICKDILSTWRSWVHRLWKGCADCFSDTIVMLLHLKAHVTLTVKELVLTHQGLGKSVQVRRCFSIFVGWSSFWALCSPFCYPVQQHQEASHGLELCKTHLAATWHCPTARKNLLWDWDFWGRSASWRHRRCWVTWEMLVRCVWHSKMVSNRNPESPKMSEHFPNCQPLMWRTVWKWFPKLVL